MSASLKTPKFTFRVSLSVSLVKYILTHIHFLSVIWNIITDPNLVLCSRSTPLVQAIWFFYSHLSFPFQKGKEWTKYNMLSFRVIFFLSVISTQISSIISQATEGSLSLTLLSTYVLICSVCMVYVHVHLRVCSCI